MRLYIKSNEGKICLPKPSDSTMIKRLAIPRWICLDNRAGKVTSFSLSFVINPVKWRFMSFIILMTRQSDDRGKHEQEALHAGKANCRRCAGLCAWPPASRLMVQVCVNLAPARSWWWLLICLHFSGVAFWCSSLEPCTGHVRICLYIYPHACLKGMDLAPIASAHSRRTASPHFWHLCWNKGWTILKSIRNSWTLFTQ